MHPLLMARRSARPIGRAARVSGPDARGRSILALIPAYEEAPRVGEVVERCRAHLPVVVIDDGSTDGTAEAAEAAGATVLRQRPNQGKGAALRVGFRYALDAGAEAVVTLDADGQHDPSEVPLFISAWTARHADLVVGGRDFRQMPLVRRLSNTIGGLALSWAVGEPIPDNQSGYRLVSRRLMMAMLDSRETGFAFEVEMIAVCIRAGWPIEWVPIRTIYAGEPSHIRPLAHGREFWRAVRRARRRVRASGVSQPPSPPASGSA
jgi:glycosyltransferase involved in cell wall biosynthesis